MHCSECAALIYENCDVEAPAAAIYICPMCKYEEEEKLQTGIKAQMEHDKMQTEATKSGKIQTKGVLTQQQPLHKLI